MAIQILLKHKEHINDNKMRLEFYIGIFLEHPGRRRASLSDSPEFPSGQPGVSVQYSSGALGINE